MRRRATIASRSPEDGSDSLRRTGSGRTSYGDAVGGMASSGGAGAAALGAGAAASLAGPEHPPAAAAARTTTKKPRQRAVILAQTFITRLRASQEDCPARPTGHPEGIGGFPDESARAARRRPGPSQPAVIRRAAAGRG